MKKNNKKTNNIIKFWQMQTQESSLRTPHILNENTCSFNMHIHKIKKK